MVRMKRWEERWRRARRKLAEGQSLVLFALLLPVLAGITGLALDAGHLYFQRRHLQTVADAAALTGAQVANFNVDNPAILADGAAQARANARTNGLADSEIAVHLPPSAAAGAYAGKADYIEVVVTRNVPHAFMGLFGQWSTTLQARAVARCVKPGYGDPAVLALSTAPDAINFNGCSSGACEVVGDVISNGGIDPNGTASHFQIDGAAYAMSQPAATNVTTTNGSYGTDSNVALLPVPDPFVQGERAQPPKVIWPYSDFTTPLPTGHAYICRDTWPPGTSGKCADGIHNIDDDTGNVTVQPSEYAVFKPGAYGDVVINGRARFESGVYSFNTLRMGANGVATDQWSGQPDGGVLFHIRGVDGSKPAVDASGSAEFSFRSIQPNTWLNTVFYVPNGSIDLGGTGIREVTGSIYAPNGEVTLHGNGSTTVVNGQVVANTVQFSGSGPTVNYASAGAKPTFGPILVNTPD
jgi:Flp pilus assembly protein TadG